MDSKPKIKIIVQNLDTAARSKYLTDLSEDKIEIFDFDETFRKTSPGPVLSGLVLYTRQKLAEIAYEPLKQPSLVFPLVSLYISLKSAQI